jgi:mannosyl-oligosaccharide alpha-1,2-mannosidase
LDNPTQPDHSKGFVYIDVTEEWWLSETMKYLWLLFFEPDVLPLDKWVFNTEGHPYRAQPWHTASSSSSSSKQQLDEQQLAQS